MKPARLGRETVVLIATAILLPGCAPPFAGFPSVERDGFRLQITNVQAYRGVGGRDGITDHGLLITAKVEDVTEQRIVSVEHALRLTEVRDQRGRDLLAMASTPLGRQPGNDTRSHPLFLTPDWIERGRGFTYWPTVALRGLPETPRKLRRLAGYARLLLATNMVHRELPASPDEATEIAPGYRVQITQVETLPGRVRFAYRTWTSNTDAGYDETLPPFLYLVELLDDKGETIERYDGMPMIQQAGIGWEERTVDLEPADRKLATVRFTVIAGVDYLEIPFSYENIPLN